MKKTKEKILNRLKKFCKNADHMTFGRLVELFNFIKPEEIYSSKDWGRYQKEKEEIEKIKTITINIFRKKECEIYKKNHIPLIFHSIEKIEKTIKEL